MRTVRAIAFWGKFEAREDDAFEFGVGCWQQGWHVIRGGGSSEDWVSLNERVTVLGSFG